MTNFNRKLERFANQVGGLLVSSFHLLALFAIGGAIVWSAAFAFWGMVQQGRATVEDILLLFIYLELGAMVGIYFATKHMPVRFLIYIAMTALTRLMVGMISVDHKPDMGILLIAGAILMLSVAVLILRFGSHKYPSYGLEHDPNSADDDTER